MAHACHTLKICTHTQVVVWRYPGMTKLATLTGHTLRVLYLALSPDGQTIVTGAGAFAPWWADGAGLSLFCSGCSLCPHMHGSRLQRPHHLHTCGCACTHAGDETLRFWNVFPGPKSQSSVNDAAVGSMMRTLIR